MFRKAARGGHVQARRLTEGAIRDTRGGRRDGHAGRAGQSTWPAGGVVTTAYGTGLPDEAIMGHARHRSPTTMRSYVCRANLGGPAPSSEPSLACLRRVEPPHRRARPKPLLSIGAQNGL